MRPLLTQHDVHMRLHDTYGMYGDEAVHITVSNTDRTNTVRITNARTNDNLRKIKINDPMLNVTDLRIGYCNHHHSCTWLTTRPDRTQRQGLSYNRLLSSYGGRPMGAKLFDMLEGKYPDMDTALKITLNNGAGAGQAISPQLAIKNIDGRTIGLYWCEVLVGMYDNNKKLFAINRSLEHRSFITLILAEEGIEYDDVA